MSSGSEIEDSTHRLHFTAELINNSDAILNVDYPIQIYGSPPGALVQVTTAALTASESSHSGEPPAPLGTFRSGQHVVLWIGLQVNCHTSWSRPPRWPTGEPSLPSRWTGYPAPATFELRDLLDFSVTSSIRQVCPR